MRTSCYAKHVTNIGPGNKFFSEKQIKQSYPKCRPTSCIQRSDVVQQLLFLSKTHLLGSKGRNDIPSIRPGAKDVQSTDENMKLL